MAGFIFLSRKLLKQKFYISLQQSGKLSPQREAAERYRQEFTTPSNNQTEMKHLFFLLIIFSCTLSFSQRKLEFVKANGKNYPSLGQEFAFGCTLDIKELLENNDELILYGFFNCDKENTGIYKVLWNSQVYLIEEAKVLIKPEDESFLKSLDSIQQQEMTLKVIETIKKEGEAAKAKVEALVTKYKTKGKLNGILFKKSKAFDQSEYTKGTGYTTVFLNTSSKTIKYIWFTVKGINPVGDLVSTQTLKGVGPIKPNVEGEYEFDYVWHTDLVETTKLAVIKIQYMDGSFKTIQNGNDLIVGEKLYEFMFPENE